MSSIENPIFITGAARSGTSMTAGIINLCGAWGGDMAGPTPYNRKGMFENTQIRNDIVKPYLTQHGWDKMGQYPLPDINEVCRHTDRLVSVWRERVLSIIKEQGFSDGKRFFYKGAKLCLIWPLWHAVFPKAQWIMVRRDVESIVRSCLKTSFMRAYSKRSGWLEWVAQHEKRFEEMHTAKLSVQEVWPQRMIDGDFTQMEMVINNLGLVWDFTAVRDFIDPGLWRREAKRG